MLRAAILFLLIALVAGALGLFRTEIMAANIAWILFVVFLVLAVLSLVFGRSGSQVNSSRSYRLFLAAPADK
jgi:uncharacterized membrane protein YtjA (UPF0391 family)